MRKYILSLLVMLLVLCGCSAQTVQNGEVNAAVPTYETTTAAKSEAAPAAVSETVPEVLGSLTVSYIDVGQADSILITTPDNKNLLIDAGEGEGRSGAVLSYLKARNITSIDTAVATHPHSDHINAMDNVLNEIPVSRFYMPGATHTTKDFENMLDALESVPEVTQAKAGMSFNVGSSVKCDILAPVSDNYKDLNDYSVVIRLTYGDTAFVFTGDAEALSENEILAGGAELNADVLKCGHHGSSSSTSDEFLATVNPKYAVISCGRDNDYGHPHRETLQKLNSAGINVLRTDEMGTITLVSDGKTVTSLNGEGVIEQTTQTITQPVQAEQGVTYIGNKNSKKYHSQACTSLPKEQNRVYFSSKAEAENNGYSPCGLCKP